MIHFPYQKSYGINLNQICPNIDYIKAKALFNIYLKFIKSQNLTQISPSDLKSALKFVDLCSVCAADAAQTEHPT